VDMSRIFAKPLCARDRRRLSKKPLNLGLIQFNPSFEQDESAQSLCDKGILHPDLSKIFKNNDLFKHQVVEPVLPMDLMGVYILLPDREN